MAEKNKNKTRDNQTVEISIDTMLDGARTMVDKGNQRRFVLKTSGNSVIVDVPLTVALAVGGFGLFFFPVWVILAFIGAIVFKAQIEVARVDALPGEEAEVSVDLEGAAKRIASTAKQVGDKASEAVSRISEEVNKKNDQ